MHEQKSPENPSESRGSETSGVDRNDHVAGRGGSEGAEHDVVSQEIAGEQAHVDRVYQALDVATRSAQQVAAEGKRIYQTDRGDYLREEDGTALFERDAFAYQSAKRLAALDSEHEGLVFGRLDLTNDTRYIGRIGVRDDDYEPLVIDWRAPAAEPFYRATPQAPMNVIRRRVLRCRNDRVVGIEDDLLDSSKDSGLLIVGEGALMASLSRARGDAMRDIVATIQAEQDEAIRAPHQGVTMIAGGPGTGKTVVALHRAAYLLYTHRRRFERGGVLVVGPSAVFMNYIERVLPSLGEDAVTLHPVGGVARDVLGFSTERVDAPEAATLKGSLRMLPVLKAVANEPLTGRLEPLRVSVKGEVLTLQPAQLTAIRNQVLEGRRINRAREAAEKALLNALWNQFTNEHELGREVFDDLASSQASFVMFMHAWWPSLEATDVLARLGDRELLDRVGANLTTTERDVLAASYDPGLMERSSRGRGNPGWSVADVALLDELVAIIGLPEADPEADRPVFIEGGADVPELVTTADLLSRQREVDPDEDPQETFAHVLVDESQDVTPMQWRMLRRRGPQASWTLVGDVAQSSYPHLEETRQAIADIAGRGPQQRFRLSTNYRSPAEVFRLAAKVVTAAHPHADLPHAVRSTGVDPVLDTAPVEQLPAALARHVADLAGQVEGTIGVLAPPSLIDLSRDALEGAPGAERVRVVTPLQAKGLEYDAVVVVSPDDIVAENPGGERVLYVALTRPTQRLVTLDIEGDAPARWRRVL
ncbi:HelD family protein [Aestuariimicrobium sp. p3-SID1156]|uniref:HelD family protein n=1 Tax=Aestuariimicrobium sp. p3-SID1156 TaxID=2916038 RepID=UPI0037C0DBF6